MSATPYWHFDGAKDGDPEALRALWEWSEPFVLVQIRKVLWLRDPYDVEDVTQQVFLELVQSMKAFEPRRQPGSFRAWLRTIARRTAWKYHGGTGRALTRVGGGLLLEEWDDPRSDLSQAWDDEHRRYCEQKILERAKAESAEADFLVFVELRIKGRGYREVAREFNISVAAVFARAKRVEVLIKKIQVEWREMLE